MEKHFELGQQMRLEGQKLLEYCLAQQKIELEECAAEQKSQQARREAEAEAETARREAEAEAEKARREAEAEQALREAEAAKVRREIEEEKAKREAEEAAEQRRVDFQLQQDKLRYEHEEAMAKIKADQANKITDTVNVSATLPDLPVFQDNKDSIDAYLERFERYAKLQKWDATNWAIALSALLSGKALEVYARLPISDITDYTKIKAALLKSYNHTEEGFRQRFRKSKPNHDENPEQYVTRIRSYRERWLETATVSTYEELISLIVKEQFLHMCPQNLQIHLNERSFASIKEMCAQGERYLQAHKQKMTTDDQGPTQRYEDNTENKQKERIECYNCRKVGHIQAECKNKGGDKEEWCGNCKISRHLEEACRHKTEFGGMITTRLINRRQRPKKLQHSNGNTRKQHNNDTISMNEGLKVVQGKVNGRIVNTLRDTGCSSVCVNKKWVLPQQITGQYNK